jgi:hypothetical protein
MVQKYMSKISGPLLNRIGLHAEVTPVNFSELSSDRPADIVSWNIWLRLYTSGVWTERIWQGKTKPVRDNRKHPLLFLDSALPANDFENV